MRSSREAIYGLLYEIDGLSDRTRREVTGFIDDFYSTLDDPKSFEKKIAGKCRNLPG